MFKLHVITLVLNQLMLVKMLTSGIITIDHCCFDGIILVSTRPSSNFLIYRQKNDTGIHILSELLNVHDLNSASKLSGWP